MSKNPKIGQGNRFPDTNWSLIGRASSADQDDRRRAMTDLLKAYMPGLRSYLIKVRMLPPDIAEDFLQDFVSDKILLADLVAKADENRGKFRSFLLKSLTHFVISKLRRPSLSFDCIQIEEIENSLSDAMQADSFDQAWVELVVCDALREMKIYCESCGRDDLWEVLDLRIVRPIFQGDVPISYKSLAQRFGLETPRKAMLLLTTAKRTFLRRLEMVIGKYVQNDEDVLEELQDLKRVLER